MSSKTKPFKVLSSYEQNYPFFLTKKIFITKIGTINDEYTLHFSFCSYISFNLFIFILDIAMNLIKMQYKFLLKNYNIYV